MRFGFAAIRPDMQVICSRARLYRVFVAPQASRGRVADQRAIIGELTKLFSALLTRVSCSSQCKATFASHYGRRRVVDTEFAEVRRSRRKRISRGEEEREKDKNRGGGATVLHCRAESDGIQGPESVGPARYSFRIVKRIRTRVPLIACASAALLAYVQHTPIRC